MIVGEPLSRNTSKTRQQWLYSFILLLVYKNGGRRQCPETLVRVCTESFISPELEEALQSVKGVVAAFERDVRTDVKWDWRRDRVPSALVRLAAADFLPEGSRRQCGPAAQQ